MLFDETVKWKCLSRFLETPEMEEYVKKLARELKISSGSASRVCRELEAEGILHGAVKGRALFYSLKNDEPLVRRLKSAWFVSRFIKFRGSWEDDELQSVALYGSRASGGFISKSDIDVLVISNAEKRAIERMFQEVKIAGLELAVIILSVAEWTRLAKTRDRFYMEVISSHVLLYGSALVVG
jgi:predicted nucleotidyltransferase